MVVFSLLGTFRSNTLDIFKTKKFIKIEQFL